MYISLDTIIKAGAALGAVLAIASFIWAIILWIQKREKTSVELAALKQTHEADIRDVKNELCELSFALLAALDGLMQLHCNGNVTKGHERLEKYLNKQAHDQN